MNPIEQLKLEIDGSNLWDGSMELQRNEYLKVQGSSDSKLYYVDEGCLRVFVLSNDEEMTIRFGYQNNFITSLDSYITEQPSEFYIQAVRKTKVRYVQKKTLLSILNRDEKVIKLWNAILEALVVQLLEREKDILISSPAERYQKVLTRSPQLFQEVPHKYIASYLRMTPETLSRIKKS